MHAKLEVRCSVRITLAGKDAGGYNYIHVMNHATDKGKVYIRFGIEDDYFEVDASALQIAIDNAQNAF